MFRAKLSPKVGGPLLLVWALGLLLIAGACGSASEAGSRPQVSPQPLKPLWEVWHILQDEYVDRSALDPQVMSRGAVGGLLHDFRDLEDRSSPRTPVTPKELPKGAPVELRPVWDTWVWLHERRQENGRALDGGPLAGAAISGMLEAVGDPHTVYIPPEQYGVEANAFEGNYQGIGAEIHKRGDRFFLTPMPDSPAAAAGLRAGDLLLAVDGRTVGQWSVYEVVNRIRGPKGSTVRLEVQHLGSSESLVLEIKRGVIAIKSVFWNMTNDQIAYLRLGAFYGNTDEAVKGTLQEILTAGARGLVLDLRNNPGGFLSSTVTVTSYFLSDGLVTYEVNAKGQRKDHRVRAGGPADKIPLVVLVNQFSASGSEVLVGALQDHRRATVVGMRTFGKGSVNLSKRLSDGGGLYYTIARWYTPKGRLIEGLGLEPDAVVIQGVTSQGDLQLEKALELLRAQIS